MSDYLKSALGYLNGGTSTNEYVGQTIEINNVKLRVTKLLAEGGCALVFAVEDINTGKEYALKRLIAVDEDANRLVIQEIETLKRLAGHPNIIQFLYAERLDRQDGKGYEYLLVTELCPGGTVADILRGLSSTNSLTLGQVCTVAYQATRAVHHMHSQQPEPIVHRDIKLENFLVGTDGLIKLCDFGSVTSQQILPDPSWNAQKRSTLEDQMAKFTTPMYRSPEIMDTWSNEPIGPPVDCWALGCILYTLISLRHPFPEGNKLAIVNGKYPPLPPSPRLACLNEIVKGCLEVSPVRRFTTAVILERLAAIAESNDIDLRQPAKIEFTPPVKPPPPPRPNPPPQPPPLPPTQTPTQTQTPTACIETPASGSAPGQASMAKPSAAPATGLFSSIRGGAGSLLRNIKDTSSKVMHSVQQSMARTELDASYLTSRILIMPYPADGIESAYRANHVEDVRAFLQARHPPPARLQLYNLSRGRANVYRLPGRHIDCSFAYASSDSNTPLLSALYQICQDIHRYLSADFSHVVVLYCTDGCRASATIACTLLIYAGVVFTPQDAITLFTSRRCQPIQLQPSELRSINYMSMLRSEHRPHVKPLALCSLVLQPVPLFTRAKDGCRPYIEIYSNGALVFSTKRPEYEEMRLFGMMEGKVALNLGNVVVRGDVTIVMFHARQQLGRVIGIKIASLHFHTGYASLTENTMAFEKKELDDVPEIGGKFRVILHATVAEENGKLARLPAPWEADTSPKPTPDSLFGSTLEMEETLENFRTAGCSESKDAIEERAAPPAPPAPPVLPGPVPATSNTALGSETVEEPAALQQAKLVEQSAREESILQEADLLNLGMPETSIEPNSTQPATKPGLVDIFSGTSQHEDDLLGGFGSFAQSDQRATPIPTIGNSARRDLLFGQEQLKASTNETHPNLVPQNLLFGQTVAQTNRTRQVGSNGSHEFLFDPLGGDVTSSLSGGLQNPKHGATLKSPNVEEGFPRNASLPNFAAQNKDPFASLASTLGAGTGLTSSWNGTPRSSNTPQSASPAPASTPVHTSPGMQRSAVMNEPTITEPAQQSTTLTSSSSFNVNKSAKSRGDMFDDLLGSQGYNFFSSKKAEKDSPRTINEMRKVEAARTMDPDRSKVAEWTEGKKSNLRALLCSLHTVLWSDAEKWQKCEMHQLVTAADVKKAYRRACLAVHPDKQRGTANENLSKLIFMELNNAWSTFENDTSQQHLFN